jgi:hypothetical protein
MPCSTSTGWGPGIGDVEQASGAPEVVPPPAQRMVGGPADCSPLRAVRRGHRAVATAYDVGTAGAPQTSLVPDPGWLVIEKVPPTVLARSAMFARPCPPVRLGALRCSGSP